MLTLRILDKIRDSFGIWDITVELNKKIYIYPITSEFAVRKVEKLIRNRHYGKALNLLKLFTTTGFNYYKETAHAQDRPTEGL